ncbi:MAG: glycoside hydrolase family 25 protein, partial [Anaerovoracaceae bacterium]
KKTRLRLNAKGRIMITFAGMILVSIIVSNLMTWFDSYDGLGEPETIPESPYDREKFRYDEKGRLQYEDDRWISRTVVDVSSYQKEIDWEQVAADGVEMAMIRLGYRGYSSGLLNLDQCYQANVKGAHKAGLDVGVYFFSQAVTVEEAEEEARFVLRNIRGKHVNGPIAFDMEPIAGADRITHLTVEQKTAIADAFCQLIEKNGHQAMVYGNPKWLTQDVDMSLLTDHDVWLAHYTSITEWGFAYTMWQYTDSGSVAGIEGSADLGVQLREKKYLAE